MCLSVLIRILSWGRGNKGHRVAPLESVNWSEPCLIAWFIRNWHLAKLQETRMNSQHAVAADMEAMEGFRY